MRQRECTHTLEAQKYIDIILGECTAREPVGSLPFTLRSKRVIEVLVVMDICMFVFIHVLQMIHTTAEDNELVGVKDSSLICMGQIARLVL